MGYVVKRLPYSSRTWKVQYQTWSPKRTSKDLGDQDIFGLGFSPMMGIEEARILCSALNKKDHIKRQQERKNSIKDRIDQENVNLNTLLPNFYVSEFEKLYIPDNKKKLLSHWLAVKKVVVEVDLPIRDWEFHKEKFYRVFKEKNFSYSYVQKLLIIINKWGKFIARKQGSFYEPIPSPRGNDKEKIQDNHEEEKGSQASEGISPIQLESNRSKFNPDHYNWLYLSVWLGLRPYEVDSLKKESSLKTWYIEDNVLWVYQTKLSGVPSKERIKPIPFKFEEQKICIDIIKQKNFRRPLNKTLKRIFEGQVTTYAGRKGFTDLMLSKGCSLEAISQWLGHKSINRTWKNYKDKKKVLL